MKIIGFDAISALNISPKNCVDWATQMLENKYASILPPKTSIKFNNGCFFNTMPSLIQEIGRYGVKSVSRYPPSTNDTGKMFQSNTPSILATILLYDVSTGELLSIMDGTWITAMRTGAVAAISINLFKRKETKSYSFIGLGNTARAALLCLNTILNNEQIEVKLLKYKDQHNDFVKRFSSYENIKFKLYESVSELIHSSEVIISSVTTAKTNFAKNIDYPEGVLVVPIHTMGFQNCDLFFDRIYCDDIGHIKNFKYFNQYKNCDEISNIFLSKNKGRVGENERIIVYNIGISLHDVFFASKIYDMVEDTCKHPSLHSDHLPKFWL
jgi:ornithine cyclodeaminase/alanine dehydrogenase-like protein (mu-crystallin family)